MFTATSSQGLAWMHEGLHWGTGARLPIVLVNVNRPLGAPWNLTCEQTDSLSQRDTGWIQYYCESNQEILDTVIQAYRVSESLSVPSMVCLDGVYLSYVAETVEIPEQERVNAYLPPYRPAYRRQGGGWKLFDAAPSTLPNIGDFMRNRYELHKLENECVTRTIECDDAFKAAFGRGYPPVEEYRCDNADVVLVTSGSAVGTARPAIDGLRLRGHRDGSSKCRCSGPSRGGSPARHWKARLKRSSLTGTFHPAKGGIFHQELKGAICGTAALPQLYGFIAGLGGADITPDLIEKAIMFAINTDQPPEDAIWPRTRRLGG